MGQTISSDFIRGHIDTIILRSLFSGTKHALEIAAFIEEKSGNKYEVKQATLYSALKRLEKLKYVRPYWNDAPEGGRRRYFEITPAGKEFADRNLSGWDYSRDVIDQLVDEVPKNLVHEPGMVLSGKSSERNKSENLSSGKPNQSFEKAEEKTSHTSERQIQDDNRTAFSVENTTVKDEKTSENFNRLQTSRGSENKKVEDTIKDPALENLLNHSQNEVNYREVLNDLFERNVKKHPENAENDQKKEDSEEKYNDYEEKSAEKQSSHFSALKKENVFDKDLRIRSQNIGKTDFSDLLEKADAEGYKIRISTGKSEKNKGKYLINRINLVSSLSVFLIFLIECFVFSLVFRQNALFSGWYYLLAIVIAALFPVYQIVVYARQPLKAVPAFNKNLIYTVLIILFNLLLIVFALAIFADTDFTSPYETAFKIAAPVLILADVFLYFLLRNLFALSGYFITKR